MRKQTTVRAAAATAALLWMAISTGPLKANAKQTASQIQQQQQKQQQNTRMPDVNGNNAPDPLRERMEDQAAKARNNDRHKRLVSDTEKLLQLSTELKDDVDKTTKNEMSVEVIRKAEQIEKLAHDVKERMKG